MFKLFLCVLIVLCSTLVGFSYSSTLYTRKQVLEAFVLELKNVKTVIRYSSKNLSQIFENSFMNYTFCEDKPFYSQWEDMLKAYTKTLTKADMDILKNFGKTLGTSDLSGELNNIDMYIALLDTQIADSQRIIETKSQIYKTLGLSLGLAIAIILI